MGREHRTAFVAMTTVNRKDFGVSWNRLPDSGGLVGGEEVEIRLELVSQASSD